jgi:hypothetical protein
LLLTAIKKNLLIPDNLSLYLSRPRFSFFLGTTQFSYYKFSKINKNWSPYLLTKRKIQKKKIWWLISFITILDFISIYLKKLSIVLICHQRLLFYFVWRFSSQIFLKDMYNIGWLALSRVPTQLLDLKLDDVLDQQLISLTGVEEGLNQKGWPSNFFRPPILWWFFRHLYSSILILPVSHHYHKNAQYHFINSIRKHEYDYYVICSTNHVLYDF